MEYLTLLGEDAYTSSSARKIQDLIAKTSSAKVDEVSAVYIHYARLNQATNDVAKVSTNYTIKLWNAQFFYKFPICFLALLENYCFDSPKPQQNICCTLVGKNVTVTNILRKLMRS
mgnify:CR=1 FL=1